jgi:hypothetical protein
VLKYILTQVCTSGRMNTNALMHPHIQARTHTHTRTHTRTRHPHTQHKHTHTRHPHMHTHTRSTNTHIHVTHTRTHTQAMQSLRRSQASVAPSLPHDPSTSTSSGLQYTGQNSNKDMEIGALPSPNASCPLPNSVVQAAKVGMKKDCLNTAFQRGRRTWSRS